MNLIKTAATATAAVALASGIYVTTRPAPDVKVAKSKSGKQVRIVYNGEVAANEEDTDFGKALVLTGSVPPEALCNVVFEAKIVKGEDRQLPDVPDLGRLLNAGALPVLIQVTDIGTGIWHCLFKGEACLEIAELPGYIGSEMHQLFKHPRKTTFLKVQAKVGSKDKEGRPKQEVAVGDADADPAAAVHFSHGWAGRQDLNFSFYQGGTFVTVKEINDREREKKEK